MDLRTIILGFSMPLFFLLVMWCASFELTPLQKEIDRLKPYEENFKILADSIIDCHRHCFRIGE
jgi:hypothetical protein